MYITMTSKISCYYISKFIDSFVPGNSPAAGEFPSQRPVTQDFDVFFALCLE